MTRILRPYAKVSTRPAANLKARLVKPKDRLGFKDKSGVVYQYQCQCGKLCVGETGRKLKTREAEHRRAIAQGNGDHSGISRHVVETGHDIMWDDIKILDY